MHVYNMIAKSIPGFLDTFRKFKKHPEKLDELAKIVSIHFRRIYALY